MKNEALQTFIIQADMTGVKVISPKPEKKKRERKPIKLKLAPRPRKVKNA